MKLKKYSHACLVIEKDNQSLVIDPGVWSDDLVIPTNAVGVIVTHAHADHCDTSRLETIYAQNPEARVYADQSVASILGNIPVQIVSSGKTVHVGDFALEFCGGDHAVIHESLPRMANLGIMIDDKLYYPGDSFSSPPSAVEVLALPVSAPWMKISEAMDFLSSIKPARAFPTHDAILSDTGKTLVDTLLGSVAEKNHITYERIQAGSSIDV